jgi:glucose-1-phosphate thymidylyltransferase
MQAIILAGGYGTRLYPLTLNAPKPMVAIGGKPIIEFLIEKLQKLPEISEIIIVANAKFIHVFEEWLTQKNYTNIVLLNDGTTSNEDRLWPVGDILFAVKNHQINEDVIILWGDNLIEDDFSELMESFKKRGNTLGLYDVGLLEYVKQLSTVTLSPDGQITQFIEKPENPESTLIGTLIYVLKQASLQYLTDVIELGKADKAGEFISYVSQKEPVYWYELHGKWFDIGTLEQLQKAEEWIDLKNR